MIDSNPRVFISYSWTSPEHEEWVLDLATALRSDGVDVILDKWDLKEGHDAIVFMEQMVTDPEIEKVIIVCDKAYAEKADSRKGGVGTETQIISPEIYAKREQDKFVAVLAEKDEQGRPYLPTYYKARIFIDLSDSDQYATNYEQLLRWIYNKPVYLKPELGKKPEYLEDSASINLGTTSRYRRALDAIKNNRPYTGGALTEYFDTVVENLELFRLESNGDTFDDKVVESIELFRPYLNEAIEIFLALGRYNSPSDVPYQLHRFFESLIPYMFKPIEVSRWKGWDYDNFRFIVHELFLYAIASLLKYERFEVVGYLLRTGYYVTDIIDLHKNLVSYGEFRQGMDSLEYRKKRLKSRRFSIRADLLKQRAEASGLLFEQLMQADFVLYLRGQVDSLRDKSFSFMPWWPETLVYATRHREAFEIFARARSKSYFERIALIFDITERNDFDELVEKQRDNFGSVPRWDGGYARTADLMGYEELATKP